MKNLRVDKNGKEVKTGNIVRIEGAYFKNDNGNYFVAYTPGDPAWSGSDYSLRKICKNGKISVAKNNIAFWPLMSCTNNRTENDKADKWNAENATIEIIDSIDNKYVIDYFKGKAADAENEYHYKFLRLGECEETENLKVYTAFYNAVVTDLEVPTKEEPENKKGTEAQETPKKANSAPIERKYYPIDERMAKTANDMNSFTDYKEGSETEEYKEKCDQVYNILDEIKEKNPIYTERATGMTDYYCRKLAKWYNDYNRNEAFCPSIMVSGAGNFPVRKKEQQNARRDKLFSTWNYLKEYKGKIEHLIEKKAPEQENKEDNKSYSIVDKTGNKLFDVLENAENKRLQLFFDEKPEETTRKILKSHGFRWAPSQKAWQRVLTNNARWALKSVEKELAEGER